MSRRSWVLLAIAAAGCGGDVGTMIRGNADIRDKVFGVIGGSLNGCIP